jgi:two-component system response regulator NreC
LSKIRLLLADDHAILRSGLKGMLEGEPDFEVVAEAASTDELIEQARLHRPDLVVLDLSMPGGGGLKAIAAIKKFSSETRFLALTMHDDPGHVHSALAAGVAGYLVKSAELSDLRSAIRAIYRGRSYVNASLPVGALGQVLTGSGTQAGAPGVRLSTRERQILKRLALGHTYRSIAAELHLSEKSVETYRSRLAEKLGIRSRAGLVRYALDIGLLEEPA